MSDEAFKPSRSFRKKSIIERRREIRSFLNGDPDLLEDESPLSAYLDLADTLSESTIGIQAFPLGICRGLLVNSEERIAVMATEEPSVIAAANFGARIIASGGGIESHLDSSVMGVQIFFSPDQECDYWARFSAEHRKELEDILKEEAASMAARGGGFRELAFSRVGDDEFSKLTAYIDVCDAMGANMLNTCGEALAAYIERTSGLRPLMAILTNSAERRMVRAEFRLPAAKLPATGGVSPVRSEERALRIVQASRIAQLDYDRAITHNKGVMNGISALALATANDTRALEAAVHAYASRDGRYRGITDYRIDESEGRPVLVGSFQAPIALASVGGGVSFHPTARAALRIMGNPSARELSETAAALGLVQNLSALLALTGSGIQAGHMRLHARRIAFAAGARGKDVDRIAEVLHQEACYRRERAVELIQELSV